MLNTGRFLGANLLAESWCENQAFWVQAPSDTLDWVAMLCLTLSYFGDWLGARAWRRQKALRIPLFGWPHYA